VRVGPEGEAVLLGMNDDRRREPPPDPELHGPKDLPDLRMLLLDRWRPDGLYGRAAELERMIRLDDLSTIRRSGRRLTELDFSLKYAPLFDGPALARASLWWVTAEMSERIVTAAASLPPTTLNDGLPLDEFGFVLFEKPLVGLDAEDETNTIEVGAILWGRTIVLDDGHRAYVKHGYGPDEDLRPGDQKAMTISSYGRLYGGAWIPLGRSEWVWGAETADPNLDGLAVSQLASMEEDRRWLSTLWLLAAQPLVVSVADRPSPRPAARRSARRALSSDVRLVDVRRRLVEAKSEPSEPDAGRKVEWSRRWIVGGEDGFWRQQACGPRWSEHRPVWIAPFEKGPKDKPLVVPERVRVVRDDPS